jgi:hypothetical protein
LVQFVRRDDSLGEVSLWCIMQKPRSNESFVVILSGFECATFSVEDVIDARETAIANGGHPSGEVVTLTIATGVQVTWCSVTDPEGNVIELQSWLK